MYKMMSENEVKVYLIDLCKRFDRECFLFDVTPQEFISWVLNSKDWLRVPYTLEHDAFDALCASIRTIFEG